MNDFIAQPVDPDASFSTLLRWLPNQNATQDGFREMADPQRELLARLREIPGLDVDAGLQYLHGRVPRYIELLRRFIATHGADGATLRAQIAQGDLAAAHFLAHTLKGVAATLGARQVSQAAAALDATLREPQGALVDHQALEDTCAALDALCAALESLLPTSSEEAASAAPDARAVDALLGELETLLSHDDALSNEALAAAAPLLRRANAADFERLAQQIDRYDYPAALATVRAWRQGNAE